MFPFKKKTPPSQAKPQPSDCEEVRRQLVETDTRLDKAIKEMNRRIQARTSKTLALVK